MHQQKCNTRQAAAYLNLSPGTLEVWRCHRRGPRYSKLGKRVVYDFADLQEFATSSLIETLDTGRGVSLSSSGGNNHA